MKKNDKNRRESEIFMDAEVRIEKKKNRNRKDLNRRLMDGFFMCLLAVSFMMSSFAIPAFAAVTAPDIVVTASTSSTSSITTNSNFQLTLTYTNMSGVPLTNLLIDFSGEDKIALISGATVYTPLDRTLADDTPESVTIAMKYIGAVSDARLSFKFIYTKAAATEETAAVVSINSVAVSSSTPAPPVDTSKYLPNIVASIIGSNTIEGGQQRDVRILLQNTNPSYAAKNVTVALRDEVAAFANARVSAVSFGTQTPIAEIKAGGSVELVATVTCANDAVPGNYKLPLDIAYSNAWSDTIPVLQVTVPVVLTNVNTAGILQIIPGSVIPSQIAAGGEFELKFLLKNLGNLPVKDAKVIITGLSDATFMISSGTNRLTYDYFESNGTKEVSFKLIASSSMKTGSYPLAFKLEYNSGTAKITDDDQQIWVPISSGTGSDNAAYVDILSINSTKSKLNPGDATSVQIVLKNTGTADIKGVRVSSEIAADMLFPMTQNLFILQNLKAGESKTLSFVMQAQPDAKRGSTPISIKVEVPDSKGTMTTINQAVAVFVEGSSTPADATKNVPKIIVKSYSAEPGLVKAGEEFLLNLEFMNTHVSKTIHNIKANFTVNEASSETGSVFTPVESSNTFFMDSIAPKGTVKRQLKLYTIPDAKSKTYNVTISFDYEDDKGNPYKTDEIIGIPVYQPARFEISEPSMQPSMMIGQPMPLSFEMYNLGKNVLYNVKMSVTSETEGAFDAQPKGQYYGNFEAGHNEYVEVMLNPMMAGPVTAKITVSYETATGEKLEVVKEVPFEVQEQPPVDPGMGGVILDPNGNPYPLGPDGQPIGPDGKPIVLGPDGLPIITDAKTGILQSIWFKAGVGVAVLFIILMVVLAIRRRKKEKGMDF
jgi:hypothetical protein